MLSHTAARWVFVLSGAAALVYQIVWQRLLVLFSGSDVYSSTLVIASFMAGLAIGHLGGGHLADRRSPRACLKLFALAEVAIAVFGLASSFLFYDVLYQRLGPLGLPTTIVAPILFVSLLWPTFFMGISLPLLARALTEDLARAAVRIGQLYGFNTLGAAAGAIGATWLLLPRVGLDGALWFGAAANLVCALTALQSLRRPAVSVETSSVPASVTVPVVDERAADASRWQPTFLVWAAIYGLAGFLALSLEIVWFRLLGVIVKSTAFTFGTLLAVYLGGLGVGSLVGIRYANRFRRPAVAFLMLQGAVGLTAGLTLLVFLGLATHVDWLATYFAGYEPLNVGQNLRRLQLRSLVDGLVFTDPAQHLPWEAVLLYLAIPALLIVPPTFLMGFAFPVLQRVVQTDFARLGRHVGALLLANVAGSAAGTLLTGWVALNVLGTAGTFKVLFLASLVFPLLALRLTSSASSSSTRTTSRVGAGMLAVAVALVVFFSPRADTLWSTLHGTDVDRIVFGEDATGLSVIRENGTTVEAGTTVFVNGIGQSGTPYGGIHTALGLLPAFIHPEPKRIAIIGLGSGDTAYGAAGRPEVETITSIEIVGPQLDTLMTIAPRHHYGGLQGLLDDPRIHHVAADGRLELMRATEGFDVIEADALRPTSAYSGNLFSDGYFELMRRQLRPQGLAVTWSPTVRVHNAFVRVFPYVVALPEILIGSNEPIVIDRDAIFARLDDPRARAHYERAGIPARDLVEAYLIEQARYTPDFDRRTLTDFNTDLFPRDELDRPAPPWQPAEE